MGGVRQCGILAVVEEAVAPAAVADEEEGGQEHQGTDGAGFPLQQEAEQVEAHEHGVVEPEGRVQRLGDEQHGEEPLQAVHGHRRSGRSGTNRELMAAMEEDVLPNGTGMMQEEDKAAGGFCRQVIPEGRKEF